MKNLPVPPVEMIKQRILANDDPEIIAEMTAYLQSNPEGVGSQGMIGSGQNERIVPLSQGE
ncbi:hypothetical protein [Psychrobacter sp. FDAARGOS_221]|uniref:hypothetical protein n=1 Tax=Psychrobacter sp. FDAARGOS_221 TaxID=1975705 RepID=UPI001D0D0ED4|nr:hypothetical protein [Psychrobacter sp. FDAARGOS_221]